MKGNTPWDKSYKQLDKLKKNNRPKAPMTEKQREAKERYQKGFRIESREHESFPREDALMGRPKTDRALDDKALREELKEVWE